jgi:hypothetical protein
MLELPKTREQSWQMYFDLQSTYAKTGQWQTLEAQLGRYDLFYFLVRLLRRPDVNRDWLFERIREVQASPDGHLDLWAREHYKLQRLDEPTPTPSGWKLHGDLQIGDELFGLNGEVIHVTALNPVMVDSEAYEIIFDDGSRIECGAEHLWTVERKTRKRAPGTFTENGIGKRIYRESVTMSARQIAEHDHSQDKRLAIPVSAPLQLPDAELAIHPYVLGCWLGDGTSVNGDITCGDIELFERITKLGVEIGHNKTPTRNAEVHRIIGLRSGLVSYGLLKNKHIPPIYLRASMDQRLELLRGLMDTDGHCNTRGTATFVNINQTLVNDVVELCHTLGLKPTRMEFESEVNGEPYIYYQVSFQAYENMAPFSLQRKITRCKLGSRPHPRRYIVECRRVLPSPMRCIQVDSADGLYLTSRSMIPTHNSTIITFALTLQNILVDPEITVGIFSHTRPIAKGFLSQIKRELESNEPLKTLYPDVLWQNPSKQSPKWSEDSGLIIRRQGNPKEATIEAHGLVDGMPTSKHYTLRVYDDVVKEVLSPEMLEKTTNAWDLSTNLGTVGGIARYIGTRYQIGDTYQVILDRGAASPRLYPATHNGRFDGTPVFFNESEWQKRLKTSSRAIVASQLLQNPLADEDAVFKTSWLKPYEIRPRTLNVYIMCDPSRGRHATSDSTAMAVVGIAAGGTKYLLDGYCHRMTLSQRWTALRTLYHRWSKAKGVQHIEVGYERFGMSSDDEYFQEQMELETRKKIPGAHFTINELSWAREGGSSKKERVERLEPDFRNGRFFLPSPLLHDGKPSVWSVVSDVDAKSFGQIEYNDAGGLTRIQMDAVQGGSVDLVAKALIVRDPSMPGNKGGRYDLTAIFLDQYSMFPFGGHDDLIDAVSRIYDLDASPPIAPSARQQNVPVFVDGV